MAVHLSDELARNPERVHVETRYGRLTGGRASNGAAVFLEIPFALPPVRFLDAKPLPDDFRYEDKEYIHEASYGVQPNNDGQAAGTLPEDKLGWGKSNENPLFCNIVAPPSFPRASGLPVRVYVHGGFLQFGSPHAVGSQAQFIAAERNEIWVNIGYRLSVFGFLASDQPAIDGNFGFKDQWIALEWVKRNIESFGGNPNDIQISGLSAGESHLNYSFRQKNKFLYYSSGAHSVHQILHHASRLPSGAQAPFSSAILQSNAILTNPKTASEPRPQFEALCEAIGLDPSLSNVMSTLQNESAVPWKKLTKAIEEDLLEHGTFRGALDGSWLAMDPDPMTWQRNGGFADGLRRAGVKSIAVGDLTEEWYLYSIAHPVKSPADVTRNLCRYFRDGFVAEMEKHYRKLGPDAGEEESTRLFGEILSDLQVHLPVRVLARDLINSGFPVLRYEIRWTAEAARETTKGYVTHGTDRSLWAFRVPTLQHDQLSIARGWLVSVDREISALEKAGKPLRAVNEILTLREDRSIAWTEDRKYHEIMRLTKSLPGEHLSAVFA